jgi:hypothetical protein
MSTPRKAVMVTGSPQLPVPPGAPLKIVVTTAGQAWVGQQAVSVPPGTDPRVAAAAVVSACARRQGRDLPAVLLGPGRGERHRMVFTATGEVFWEEAVIDEVDAVADADEDTALPRREPPANVDPAAIPAWPHFNIVLTD